MGEATKYMDQMCKALGEDLEDVLEPEEVDLLEKLKFSKHEITEIESDYILNRMNEISKQKWKEAKVLRKIKMVVWEGLR